MLDSVNEHDILFVTGDMLRLETAINWAYESVMGKSPIREKSGS